MILSRYLYSNISRQLKRKGLCSPSNISIFFCRPSSSRFLLRSWKSNCPLHVYLIRVILSLSSLSAGSLLLSGFVSVSPRSFFTYVKLNLNLDPLDYQHYQSQYWRNFCQDIVSFWRLLVYTRLICGWDAFVLLTLVIGKGFPRLGRPFTPHQFLSGLHLCLLTGPTRSPVKHYSCQMLTAGYMLVYTLLLSVFLFKSTLASIVTTVIICI